MHAKLLFADTNGTVLEHPTLGATVRHGETIGPPTERPRALPAHARLVHLPGRRPVGIDPESGQLTLLREVRLGRKTIVPSAVGALLPPGFTRTFLPGELKDDGPTLPQWAYAAAAWTAAGPVVWALRTDARTHWDPARYSTGDLSRRVARHRARFPGNKVLAQLEVCALTYRCFTSQNIFYERDEGALPASVHCNASCIGCISDQSDGDAVASHERMDEGPTPEEMAEVATHHLSRATGRTMVSFGQGCEGEPLTRYRAIARAIALTRSRTARGSININTNASLPHALEALLEQGLDAVRVSLNAASPDLYGAYYRPHRYDFSHVEQSLAVARRKGAYVALNLLTFPGVTDRRGEVAALVALIRRHRVDQVQTRSLCIDPMSYLETAADRGAGGAPMGVRAMLLTLKRECPWLVIGNFARGLTEREKKTGLRPKGESRSPARGRTYSDLSS